MNPRTKFLIGFLLVAGTAGYLMASSIRETGMYYLTASELAKVAADVIVERRLDTTGTFHATVLLARCASRFEAVPDKYRDTPGYQAASKRAS